MNGAGLMSRPPLYRRRPFLAGLIRQLPLLAVLLAVAVGLLLPLRRVGFLAVRSRPVDVMLLAGTGVLMTVIALAIPAT